MDENSDGGLSVNELWHKNIFIAVVKTEEYEKLCRDGMNSIEQIIQVNPSDIPYVQFSILKQLITELDMLLDNTKIKMKEDFYKQSKKEIKNAQEIIINYPNKILEKKYDQISGRESYRVTKLFWKILETARDIRIKLVVELSSILFGYSPDTEKKKKWD